MSNTASPNRSQPLLEQLLGLLPKIGTSHILVVAIFAVCLAIFYGFKKTITFYTYQDLFATEAVLYSSIALSLLLVWVDYRDLGKFFTYLLRGFGVFCIIYFWGEPFFFAPVQETSTYHYELINSGRYVALALAVLGLVRPSFLLPALIYLWAARHAIKEMLTFPLDDLDYGVLIECGVFVILGALVVQVLRGRVGLRRALRLSEQEWTESLRSALMLVGVTVIAVHMANYFWSALAKMRMDGGYFSWMLDNRTYEGIPQGIELNAAPLSAWPAAAQWVYDLVEYLVEPMNVAIVALQFAAFAMVFGRRTLLPLLGVYDVLHLGIYFIYGLFFYKWIFLNSLYAFCLVRDKTIVFKRSHMAVAAIIIIGGPSIQLFGTAELAWYDTTAMLSRHFEAIDRDGNTYKVPSHFFGTASYLISQNGTYAPPDPTHFPNRRWGSEPHYKTMLVQRECEVPSNELEPRRGQFPPVERTKEFMRRYHALILTEVDENGFVDYYRRLHHHMAAPFKPDPFYRVDKREIVAYRYVLESVCVSLENGHLKRHIVKREEFPIPLDEASTGVAAK